MLNSDHILLQNILSRNNNLNTINTPTIIQINPLNQLQQPNISNIHPIASTFNTFNTPINNTLNTLNTLQYQQGISINSINPYQYQYQQLINQLNNNNNNQSIFNQPQQIIIQKIPHNVLPTQTLIPTTGTFALNTNTKQLIQNPVGIQVNNAIPVQVKRQINNTHTIEPMRNRNRNININNNKINKLNCKIPINKNNPFSMALKENNRKSKRKSLTDVDYNNNKPHIKQYNNNNNNNINNNSKPSIDMPTGESITVDQLIDAIMNSNTSNMNMNMNLNINNTPTTISTATNSPSTTTNIINNNNPFSCNSNDTKDDITVSSNSNDTNISMSHYETNLNEPHVHSRKNNKSSIITNQLYNNGVIKPYKCQYCSKPFTFKKEMIKHQTIHIGPRPYQCRICAKQFDNKSHLDSHLNNKHAYINIITSN